MGLLEKVVGKGENDEISRIVDAMTVLAKSNEKLANAHEEDIKAVRSEYKDLKTVVETLAASNAESIKELTKSTSESINQLTLSMSETSKSLTEFSLKSQHGYQQNLSSIRTLKESIQSQSVKVDGILISLDDIGENNNNRDIEIAELKKDVAQSISSLNEVRKMCSEIPTIKKDIESNEKAIATKGKWWSDNWSKVFSVLIAFAVFGGLVITALQSLSDKGGP